MYQKKPSKREKLDTSPYTIMRYDNRPQAQWTDNYCQVVSIDPATDTYAFRIERRWSNGYIQPLAFERVKFTKELDENRNCLLYMEISQFLDRYLPLYQDCHFILVERQMVPNYRAIRVAQHTFSYFINVARSSTKTPTIIEVDPKLKGKLLDIPKGLNSNFTKKWGVEKSKELLRLRGDHYSITKMESYGAKQDDMADTVIQIEAVMKHFGMPVTPQTSPGTPPITLIIESGPCKPTLQIL